MEHVQISWLTILLTAVLFREADSIRCYNCTGTNTSATSCTNVADCAIQQVCHHIRSDQDDQHMIKYSLGCVDIQSCNLNLGTTRNTSLNAHVIGRDIHTRDTKIKRAPVIGRYIQTRDTKIKRAPSCDECCSTDLCNNNLCSDTDACEDKPGHDCIELSSLFNVCKDIHHAKLICRKTCGLCSLVDGHWVSWQEWSLCSTTCGTGSQSRKRTCTDPPPANNGLECQGNATDYKSCVLDRCPVHGGWTSWNSWGTCSVTCGVGMQSQSRTCTNPLPSHGGRECPGDSNTYQICMGPPCIAIIEGHWSNWVSWGTCSATCGDGFKTRTRLCNNPPPSGTGKFCDGINQDVGTCNNGRCQGVVFYTWIAADQFTSVSDGDTVLFDHLSLSTGGGYNSTSGVFTAPHPGTYGFSWTIPVVGDGYIITHLMQNNIVKGTLWADYMLSGTPYINSLTTTGHAFVQLDIGDHVNIKVYKVYNNAQIYSTINYVLSTFSGWMIN